MRYFSCAVPVMTILLSSQCLNVVTSTNRNHGELMKCRTFLPLCWAVQIAGKLVTQNTKNIAQNLHFGHR